MSYYARISISPRKTVHLAEVPSKDHFPNNLSAICGRDGSGKLLEGTAQVADCVFCLRKEKEIPKERVIKEERWWVPFPRHPKR
jgi:hypothetical protein